MVAAGMTVSMAACGNKAENYYEPGVTNTDTSQTDFTIMGGISALSPGYEDNEVLNQMQEDAGIKINWNVMSDSLAEDSSRMHLWRWDSAIMISRPTEATVRSSI